MTLICFLACFFRVFDTAEGIFFQRLLISAGGELASSWRRQIGGRFWGPTRHIYADPSVASRPTAAGAASQRAARREGALLPTLFIVINCATHESSLAREDLAVFGHMASQGTR